MKQKQLFSFNNSNNIFDQKNLNNFLSESSICYVCNDVKNAFNKCCYCNKFICSHCLQRCQGCQKMVCKFDREDFYHEGYSVCFDCCKNNQSY